MQIKAALNQQISKWFLNNSHLDRKAMGIVSARSSTSTLMNTGEEDDIVAGDHISELKKEMKKKSFHWDNDKVSRLLFLTYLLRAQKRAENKMRFGEEIGIFPCFETPLFVSLPALTMGCTIIACHCIQPN